MDWSLEDIKAIDHYADSGVELGIKWIGCWKNRQSLAGAGKELDWLLEGWRVRNLIQNQELKQGSKGLVVGRVGRSCLSPKARVEVGIGLVVWKGSRRPRLK